MLWRGLKFFVLQRLDAGRFTFTAVPNGRVQRPKPFPQTPNGKDSINRGQLKFGQQPVIDVERMLAKLQASNPEICLINHYPS